MKASNISRIAWSVGAIAAVAAMLALAAPRAVHAAVVALVQVANTASNPVPVAAPTHLGVQPSQFVNLQLNYSILAFRNNLYDDFSRVLADGGVDSPFQIPANEVLVITDVYCRVVMQAGVTVMLQMPDSSDPKLLFYERSAFTDPNGIAEWHDHLTGGLVFSSVPEVEFFSTSSNAVAPDIVRLVGYLAPNQ